MEPPPPDGSASSAHHPPLSPGLLPPPRTTWPTVLGIIAIVLGALGFLQGLVSLIMPLLFPFLPNMQSQSGFDPFAGMAHWHVWLLLVGVVTVILGGVLLAGGILLNARRSSARGVIVFWAIGKMLLAVGSSFINYQIQQAQFASMQQSGMNMGGMQAFMTAFGLLGVVIGIVWVCALPVFMLIWFCRAPIRREVRMWNASNRAMQSPGMAMPGL